ncbi:GAD-like domain-containing protein [Bacillus sp. DX4.1]|uniref:GAD-like domain-containing protein n=1 Tax=Bacillus sp. DX4.1 TaxID=3055867 RepID=UPI0025A2CB5B|nr:GAD-like domain-containing protein [Bacillus sp. DX4.1]MDM5186252.1 GAD-like domain-containing protein [Bacillus sp. DX4.1]
MLHVLSDFEVNEKVSSTTIDKYRNKVLNEIIEFWERYEYGSFLNGYLKVVNPDDFMEVLQETSKRYTDGIVLFSTALGDLIIWSEGYVRILNYRYGVIKTIMSKIRRL